MKKLEIIVKPEKLEVLRKILEEQDIRGLSIINAMGYGNQRGVLKKYRGVEYPVNLQPQIKVDTVVTDERLEGILDAIMKGLCTGEHGNGKVFVSDVQDALRISTGDRGDKAL